MTTLMILGAGLYQVPAIRMARKMGLRVVALSCYPDDPGLALADAGFPISTTDRVAVLETARREQVDGIMTIASEIAAPVVAEVAAELGLPGIPPPTAEIVSNKFLLRTALAEAGVETLGFAEVKGPDDVTAFLERYPGPAMIKPMGLSGSRGVVKVAAPAEAEAAYRTCRSAVGQSGGILVEQFVPGPDLGGECLVRAGRILFCSLTLKCVNDHHVPIAHTVPAGLSVAETSAAERLIGKAVSALGIRDGVVDFDLRLGPHGFRIIEMGGRLGGNWVPQLLSVPSGVDLIAEGIRLALGWDAQVRPDTRDGVFTVRILGADRGGRITRLGDPATFLPAGDVLEWVYDRAAGDAAERFDQGARRLGHVLFRSRSMDQALERVARLADAIEVQ